MAYQPPQGGYPPYGGPSHSPQPGYHQPPPGPPPQGHSPYPPAQTYQYPPQGYAPPPGPPPQGYPPQQPGYNQPPPQGYPPQAPYGQPSPGYPPQPYSYGGQPPGPPPQQGYGQPIGYGPPPSQGQYGAPPMQQAYAPPTPPSPGYVPGYIPQGEASHEADVVRKAMKGMGTDEQALIRILARPDPIRIAQIRAAFETRHKRNLENDITSEVSGYFREALLAIVRGPLAQDVINLHKAIDGAGTNEAILNDVLLGRSNADMNAIKQAYAAKYKRSLEKDVAGDLSFKTERLFAMVLAATRQEDSASIHPHNVEQDVAELHRATEGKVGTDQIAVCAIISNRSDGCLRAIALAYEAKYRIPLEKVIEREFTGHMQDALLMMVRAGTDRAMRDARLLEDTMSGMGTKDDLLVNRVVRFHWNRAHMEQVKGAYRVRYKRELRERIKGDTRGDYERLLLAMIE